MNFALKTILSATPNKQYNGSVPICTEHRLNELLKVNGALVVSSAGMTHYRQCLSMSERIGYIASGLSYKLRDHLLHASNNIGPA